MGETPQEEWARIAKEKDAREWAEIKKWAYRGALSVLSVIGLFVFFGSFFTINERERGVVLRWNKISSIAEPGLHFKLPIISSVVELPVDNRISTVEKMSAGSSDQQEAIIKASLNWRIDPARVGEVYARFRTLENAESSYVLPRIQARTKVVFGQFTAATTFSNRAKLNSAAEADIQSNLGEWFIVDGLQIEDVDFGSSYTAVINERMQAEVLVAKERQTLERERVQAEIKNTQADAEMYSAKAKGDGEAYATRVKGEAEAIAIKAKGDALKENPGLVQLELAGRWNGITPSTYIGDGKGALPILPLGNHALDQLKPVYR